MAFRNIRLHPVLRLIYFLLRVMAAVGTRFFYRRRAVLGRENLQFDGPAIVISNHPSTLMDVLNVGIHIRQEMFFLANYGLFKHPISNWLLTRLFCIPIKRAQDVASGESRDNMDAFEQCFQHLEQCGVLYIAPEGVSYMNRWVRPFKTGTARIALGLENRRGWSAGMKIIPIGLSYDNANLFRSGMAIHVGSPVLAADWREAWQKDPVAAVDHLTQTLEERVRALSIDVGDETGEKVMAYWEQKAQAQEPLSPQAAYFRSKKWADSDLKQPALVANALQAIAQTPVNRNGSFRFRSRPLWWHWPFLLLGFPAFLLGAACWALPCAALGLLTKKLNLYIGYEPTVKVLGGLLFFPFWLWLLVVLLRYTGWAWPSSLICLLVIVLGFVADTWWAVARGKAHEVEP